MHPHPNDPIRVQQLVGMVVLKAPARAEMYLRNTVCPGNKLPPGTMLSDLVCHKLVDASVLHFYGVARLQIPGVSEQLLNSLYKLWPDLSSIEVRDRCRALMSLGVQIEIWLHE